MKKNPHKGRFIAFEGLDGSGQTTQANLLKNHLTKKGFKVILTKEPTKNNKAGKFVNKILNQDKKLSLNKLKKLQKRFAKDRNWHQENIVIPSLKKDKIVITDRSQFSSFAFGAASGIDLDYLLKINEKFIEPDIIILLKTSPKTSIQRIQKRGIEETIFEKEKQFKKVWDVFEKLAKRFKNIIIINGEKSIEEIHEKVWQIVRKIL